MSSSMSRDEDHVLGCLLGGALGDAIGGPYEGRIPPFAIDLDGPWRLSDDTQLTLATCESIMSAGRVDPAAIAITFADWFQRRRFRGLGASTFKALTELAVGGHWALVGRKGEHAAGAGAAMRIAPLAFFCDPSDVDARRTIRDVCRITHHSDEAYAGALALLVAIRAAWLGHWAGEPRLLELVGAALLDSGVRDRLGELAGVREVPLTDLGVRFGSSGHVVDAVPLALAAAERVLTGFETTLTAIVACGGDTDTIASMTGQVAGMVLGASRLPEAWLGRIGSEEPILEIAGRFAHFVLTCQAMDPGRS